MYGDPNFYEVLSTGRTIYVQAKHIGEAARIAYDVFTDGEVWTTIRHVNLYNIPNNEPIYYIDTHELVSELPDDKRR